MFKYLILDTPDTWWSDVPDTFALLSRRWSDKFYDMESLVDPSDYYINY